MNSIRINPNECVICRKDKNTTESTNNAPGPKRYKCQRQLTTAEAESSVFRLLHLNSSKISKIQNNTKHFGSRKNIKQVIASAYCTECSKRNHEVFNLITEIYQLHLKLGDLREVIKSEFRNSFAFPEDDAAPWEKYELSEILCQRNKWVRHEIARAIGLNLNLAESEHEGLEDEPYARMPGNTSGHSGDGDEGIFPDVLHIEIDSDPEVRSSDINPVTWPQIEPEVTKSTELLYKLSETNCEPMAEKPSAGPGVEQSFKADNELKKLHNLKDLSINIEPLPSGIIYGRSVDVSLLETKLRQQPTRQSKRIPSIAPLILDFHDEVMSRTYSPEDSSSNSEDYPSPSHSASTGSKKKGKSRAENPEAELFVCTLKDCPRQKPFRTQDDLDCHRKKVHEGVPKPFKCPTCDSSFVDAPTRRRHIKLIHLQIKKYPCEVCGKKYGDISNLKVHMSSHTSERPIQCAECGQTFKIQRALSVHIQRVHRNERPHSCDRCGKSFHTAWKLKNHVQGVHFKHETPYMCELCGKGFPIQGNLYWHKRVHHRPKTEEEERIEAERQAERDRRAAGGKRIRNRKKKAPKKPASSEDELEEVEFNAVPEDCSHRQESEEANPSTSFTIQIQDKDESVVNDEPGYPKYVQHHFLNGDP